MNLSIREAATALQIKESLLRKYLFYNQIKKARRSLSNRLYFQSRDLKQLARQVLILRAKNQKYFKQKEVTKKHGKIQ